LILIWVMSVVIARRAIVTRNGVSEADFIKMNASCPARVLKGNDRKGGKGGQKNYSPHAALIFFQCGHAARADRRPCQRHNSAYRSR
jgi:hypothetical protein